MSNAANTFTGSAYQTDIIRMEATPYTDTGEARLMFSKGDRILFSTTLELDACVNLMAALAEVLNGS